MGMRKFCGFILRRKYSDFLVIREIIDCMQDFGELRRSEIRLALIKLQKGMILLNSGTNLQSF